MGHGSGTTGEWDRLLAAERRLQAIVSGSILVGGTAAVLHARHRVSLDGDHVVPDLRDRFEDVLDRLERTLGSRTERIQPPVLILGALDGVLSGVRQLRRRQPLETEVIDGLRVPTLAEMARVKAWLLLERNSTRDYLDTVVLIEKVGPPGLSAAFAGFSESHPRGPAGGPPLLELVDRLGAAGPSDRRSVDLRSYKGVAPPWNEWTTSWHAAGSGRSSSPRSRWEVDHA